MSRKQSKSRIGRLEVLEPRLLMAGDVLVSVVDGRMIVEGDELGNQIAITSGPEPGSFAVHGLDGTNVILQPPPVDPGNTPQVDPPQAPVVVHGIRHGIQIGMGDGDDRVVLRNLRVHGEVAIRMGEGDDQVIVGVPPLDPTPPEPVPPEVTTRNRIRHAPPPPVGIGGALRIGTGEGNDRVHVGQAGIRGSLEIATDGGDDMVVLGIPPMDPPVDPMPAAEAGETMDPQLPLAALRVGHGIRVQLGEGNDGMIANHVGSIGGLHADGGVGDDNLAVRDSRLGRLLRLQGGEGDGVDHINVGHVSAHVAAIATGGGNDHVRIVDSLFHLLGVHLGEGDDTLAVEGNSAHGAILIGGEGQDTLLGLRNNRFGRQFVRGFELPAMDGGAT